MEGKQSRPGSGSTRKILASSTDALDLGENTSGEGDVAEGAGGGVGNNHSSNTINGSDSSKSPLLTASNSSNGAIANNSSAYRGVDLLSRELKETKMRYDEMSEKMNSIEVEMEGVRSERNFYFNKLTDIEALLKEKKFAVTQPFCDYTQTTFTNYFSHPE